ncbi:hypothetical protein P4O66_003470 [Electrophorus voltai]|uniref:Shisa N-terminal domain-containing protein n=1 Tax=Electrophorus voltai TaxID=2609070 RepID=A0AAD9DM25_9TELE|nr:hypothetical protein P4O66_003470 [Electrophorus voltai]
MRHATAEPARICTKRQNHSSRGASHWPMSGFFCLMVKGPAREVGYRERAGQKKRNPLCVLSAAVSKKHKNAPRRTPKVKDVNGTLAPTAVPRRVTQLHAPVVGDHDTCLGYYDVSGQYDKEFACNNTDHRYCCGSCFLRFCCPVRAKRLEQKACTNYNTPDWIKTQPPSPAPTGNTYDPALDQTNTTVYITCGVVAFIVVLGISVKVAYDKATRPPQEMNVHRRDLDCFLSLRNISAEFDWQYRFTQIQNTSRAAPAIPPTAPPLVCGGIAITTAMHHMCCLCEDMPVCEELVLAVRGKRGVRLAAQAGYSCSNTVAWFQGSSHKTSRLKNLPEPFTHPVKPAQRALADILRQQGPTPMSQYEEENMVTAVDGSPKDSTPVRSSKNHYTPVHTKANHVYCGAQRAFCWRTFHPLSVWSPDSHQTLGVVIRLSPDPQCGHQTLTRPSVWSPDSHQTLSVVTRLSPDPQCGHQTLTKPSVWSPDSHQTLSVVTSLIVWSPVSHQTLSVVTRLSPNYQCGHQTHSVVTRLSPDPWCGHQTLTRPSVWSPDSHQTLSVVTRLSPNPQCGHQTLTRPSVWSPVSQCGHQFLTRPSVWSPDSHQTISVVTRPTVWSPGSHQTLGVVTRLSPDPQCGHQTLTRPSVWSPDPNQTVSVVTILSSDHQCGHQTLSRLSVWSPYSHQTISVVTRSECFGQTAGFGHHGKENLRSAQDIHSFISSGFVTLGRGHLKAQQSVDDLGQLSWQADLDVPHSYKCGEREGEEECDGERERERERERESNAFIMHVAEAVTGHRNLILDQHCPKKTCTNNPVLARVVVGVEGWRGRDAGAERECVSEREKSVHDHRHDYGSHLDLTRPLTPKIEKPRKNHILTSQTEPYDLSFSRSFQNLTHLPPTYEMAIKADLIVKVCENSVVKVDENSVVKVHENSVVKVYENSVVKVYENSVVKVCANSVVKLYENSVVKVYENSVVKVCENSVVKVYENSVVKVCANSVVKVYENSVVKVYENSVVKVCENSVVKVYENSVVKVDENSVVKVYENSVVKVYENSVVKVHENSVVKVYENSVVKMYENSVEKVHENSVVKWISMESPPEQTAASQRSRSLSPEQLLTPYTESTVFSLSRFKTLGEHSIPHGTCELYWHAILFMTTGGSVLFGGLLLSGLYFAGYSRLATNILGPALISIGLMVLVVGVVLVPIPRGDARAEFCEEVLQLLPTSVPRVIQPGPVAEAGMVTEPASTQRQGAAKPRAAGARNPTYTNSGLPEPISIPKSQLTTLHASVPRERHGTPKQDAPRGRSRRAAHLTSRGAVPRAVRRVLARCSLTCPT